MAGSIVQNIVVDNADTTSTTVAATINGVAAGNTLVVQVGWDDPPGTTTCTVSDGTAHTSLVAKQREATNNQAGQLFYRFNVAANNYTVTATFSTTSDSRRIQVLEISGVTTTDPKDQATGQPQTTPGTTADAVSSGATSATTNAKTFVVGLSQDVSQLAPGTGTVTAGTGFTINGSGIILPAESKSVTVTGAQTATLTQSVNNSRITFVAALIEAAVASASPKPPQQTTLGPGGVPMGATPMATPGQAPSYGAVRWQNWESYPWGPFVAPAAPAAIPSPIDPQLTLRKPPQIDLTRNIAAFAVEPPMGLRNSIEPVLWKRPAVQVELLPNIAIQVSTAVYVPTPPLDPVLTARKTPQFDQPRNIAVTAVEPPMGLRVAPEPLLWKRPSIQVELVPNIAVRVLASTYVPPAPLEPILWKRRAFVPDVPPNLAVFDISEITVTISSSDETFQRKWAQPDLYPNIAATVAVQTPIIRSLETPTKRAVPPQIDYFPNIAALVAPPQVLIIAPIEPLISKRYPPQISTPPNIAVFAPAESVPPIPAPIEPTKMRVPRLHIDVFPNIAVQFNNVPPAVTGIHLVNMSATFGIGLNRMGTNQ